MAANESPAGARPGRAETPPADHWQRWAPETASPAVTAPMAAPLLPVAADASAPANSAPPPLPGPITQAEAGNNDLAPPPSDSPYRVLIVEDDAHIADLLRMHLGDEGYDVAHAASGDAGLRLLEQEGPWDALVLDVMLPGVDGLQVCQRARAMARYVPIIIISARGSETQRIVGLELGADDYLAKPFSMPELVARVRALLRRAEAMAQSARIDAGAIELGGLQLDPVARTASVDGNALELTPREFDLLLFFARHPDQVFARMELLNQVWGYQHDGYEHTVNTHINRLRSKIDPDRANPRRLLTVWGRGYKLVDPAGAAAVAGASGEGALTRRPPFRARRGGPRSAPASAGPPPGGRGRGRR